MKPACTPHGAAEWGAGQADRCEDHAHWPDAEVRRAVEYLRHNSPSAVARIEHEAIDSFIRDELPGLLAEAIAQVHFDVPARSFRYVHEARELASTIEQHRAEGREPA
jgi:hypothetical protein